MLGLLGGGVKARKALLLTLVLAACFWRSYPRQVATHADLLVAMAQKGADLVAAGRLTAENLPELIYPLERARAFARSVHVRAGDVVPPSLVALEELIGRYRAFVDELDRVRRTARGDAARAALVMPLDAVVGAGERVREALTRER